MTARQPRRQIKSSGRVTSGSPDSPTRVACAIYLRMSQDRSHEEQGIERHEEDCRALADELGWEVIAVYTDNDISAYGGKRRPGYEEMIAAIEAGEIKGVLAYHPSRLHRRVAETEPYIALCDKFNVETRTVAAGYWDLSTATGRHYARMSAAADMYESELKGERVARRRRQGAKQGVFSGGARPYGYTKDSSALVADEAKELRNAAAAVVRGASLRSLVKDLNERGVSTATGKGAWTSKQLKDTLISPRIAGLSSYHGEVVGKAQWPAIVSEETWRAVASILTNPARRTNGNPGPGPKWLGSGIYRCGVCQKASVRVSTYGSYRKKAYRCANTERLAGGHVSRSAEKVDLYVESAVVARLQIPGFVLGAVDTDDPELAATLTAELELLRSRKDELVSMQMAGEIDRSQLATGTAEFNVRAAEITAMLARMGKRSPLTRFKDADAADIPAIWDGLGLDDKRAVLEYVAEVTIYRSAPGGGVRFDTDSVVIDWKF